jgi:hypothetical protein
MFGHQSTFTFETNTFLKCVHSTYLWTMLYIHIPLSSYHLRLARMLGSRDTSKLMGCGPPQHILSSSGCTSHSRPCNPYQSPPKPDSQPSKLSGGVFSSLTIVTKPNVIFSNINFIYNSSASKISINIQ